ncbi:MAG: GspE/PulE family protein [Phycisphaerae bacterium]|nr:GspE/PulE family protein [Phycisphaerae bacterium]NNF41739.1 type II/IV secretion system protein [Phycisphaerales bacterium]
MGIGSILVERGLISDEQLHTAIDDQNRTGERLDTVLVRLGYVTATQVLEAIGQQFAMPIVDLAAIEVEPDVLQTLPAKLVFKQRCVPLERRNGTLRVATCDPFELTAFDELRLLTGMSIELVLADEQDIRKFIRTHYGVAGDTLDELSDHAEATTLDDEGSAGAAAEQELEQAQAASVIRLVNDLLIEAIRERATDVHIEPYEDHLSIRYRVDGVLSPAGVPPTVNRFRNAITSRLKIMANLNIAEKRKPQDGRITLRRRGQEYDLRVSVIPMIFGEGVVLRILNKTAAMLELEQLGMDTQTLAEWDDLIARPHGILLATGPTGSGKSTTLYASLSRVVSDEVKAITVEDPVEYHVDGVNQIQVSRQVGLDFAAGLRAILRHDPDILMIGEIRDLETAEAAVQASLTGHLVFSTLHTNDAAGSITRLLDMGVEPFLVTSAVEGVLAQRLLRTVCPDCRTDDHPEPGAIPPDFPGGERAFAVGAGCRECRNTGYRGRLGIYELLVMTDPLREMVVQRRSARDIAQTAIENDGMRTLRAAGFDKVAQGATTIPEVIRVTKI